MTFMAFRDLRLEQLVIILLMLIQFLNLSFQPMVLMGKIPAHSLMNTLKILEAQELAPNTINIELLPRLQSQLKQLLKQKKKKKKKKKNCHLKGTL